jgi:hypothetical protein
MRGLIADFVVEARSGDAPVVVTLAVYQGEAMCVRLANTLALSYVWGNARRTEVITCNQQTLGITPNLEEALEAIRELDNELSI